MYKKGRNHLGDVGVVYWRGFERNSVWEFALDSAGSV